jgi:formylmethanofuran dehydrogenase subunit A
MTQLIKITGAKIYDPINGVNGVARDLWIRDAMICEPPKNNEIPTRTIDAAGYVIMPGGIDMLSHVAGSLVNTGRSLIP